MVEPPKADHKHHSFCLCAGNSKAGNIRALDRPPTAKQNPPQNLGAGFFFVKVLPNETHLVVGLAEFGLGQWSHFFRTGPENSEDIVIRESC